MTSRRAVKLTSLADAAARVVDGTRLAIGGFGVYNRPMAFVRELIRRGVRDLTIVTTTSGPETELLVGAGCVARLETSYAGLEKWGLARRTRAAIEAGEIEVVDYSEVMAFDRFRAAEDGWDFLPVDYLAGNSLLEHRTDIVPFVSPLTGRPLSAVPVAATDIAIVHVPAADEFGNAMLPADRLMPQGLDEIIARSCDRVLLTAERIVDAEYVRRRPHLVALPAFRVEAVATAPWGAHPCPMFGAYGPDAQHFGELAAAGREPEAFARYLDENVYGLADEDEYLERLGFARVLGLRART